MKRQFLILLLLPWIAFANDHVVHFVLLIPTDMTEAVPEKAQAITNSALHLQSWYRNQMGGKTFTLHDPICEVYYTTHDSNWYSTFHYDTWAYQLWWIYNVLIEANLYTADPNAQNLTGAWYCCEEFDSWVVYVDSEPAPGQAGDTLNNNGGYMGFSALGGSDIASLQGISPIWSQCRGIGGSGHEMGLGLGLTEFYDLEWGIAIMGTGYLGYPDAILRSFEKDWLNTSPFFTDMPYQDPPEGLCPFSTATPTPTATASPSPSATSTPTPTPTPIHLSAPQAKPATNVKNTSFKMNWTAVQGATSYRVDVAWDINFVQRTVNDFDVGNLLGQFVYGCVTHTDYYYRVRAFNGLASPNSNVIHVRTK